MEIKTPNMFPAPNCRSKLVIEFISTVNTETNGDAENEKEQP